MKVIEIYLREFERMCFVDMNAAPFVIEGELDSAEPGDVLTITVKDVDPEEIDGLPSVGVDDEQQSLPCPTCEGAKVLNVSSPGVDEWDDCWMCGGSGDLPILGYAAISQSRASDPGKDGG